MSRPIKPTAVSFYSSPSCDGDQKYRVDRITCGVSILPRLATGIGMLHGVRFIEEFLFFPVLRRGSLTSSSPALLDRFYSSPSCDGDPVYLPVGRNLERFYSSPSCDGDHAGGVMITDQYVSILPRLATGINNSMTGQALYQFLFFPVLRRGSRSAPTFISSSEFLFFPVLRRGSLTDIQSITGTSFYSSPSCDGDR